MALDLLQCEIQFFDQVNVRLISQLIICISNLLQKLLMCFNGTIIPTSLVPLDYAWPVIFSLHLNKILWFLFRGKSIIALLCLKLVHLYSIVINFVTFSNKYHDILLNYTLALLHQYHEHHLLVYYIFHLWI